MGWWKIIDTESGGIDISHTCPTNAGLANAVPGYDLSDDLYNGDAPADIMGDALQEIRKEYQTSWGRPAKKDELIAVFNFCLNGMFPRHE